MAEGNDQDKTEEATPFKLKKAREKGNVARGMDIAFFGTLAAFCMFSLVAGEQTVAKFTSLMRGVFSSSIDKAGDTEQVYAAISQVYMPAALTLALLGGTIIIAVILVQILQLKGMLFSAHPLKPDGNRLNPMKGLQRLFSIRTLKEALKNIVKMAIYVTAAYLVAIYCIRAYGHSLQDSGYVAQALGGGFFRLLFLFTLIALIFSIIDQVIVRHEFRKQMRMSKSEVKRENKDREGEPRIKQKRKQLHAEFVRQTKSIGDLKGSDLLVVNPQHFAVGLTYKPGKMDAPQVSTKGRNRFALLLKGEAMRHGIPIIHDPPLARTLFRYSKAGQVIPADTFHRVAKMYLTLERYRPPQSDVTQDETEGDVTDFNSEQ